MFDRKKKCFANLRLYGGGSIQKFKVNSLVGMYKTRFCERMSCEEFKNTVYICGYAPVVKIQGVS